jgi:uncharacterized protein YbjT (DUF2867 family)
MIRRMRTPGPSGRGPHGPGGGSHGARGPADLQELLDDDTVAAVHALVRRPLGLRHPRLTEHTVDFARLPPLPPVDEAYLALGTTIKAAGSEAAFRAVDFDASLAVACAAQVAGARRIGVVSAMQADAGSHIFYSRVKGELEEAVAGLGYEGRGDRPSFAAGGRPRGPRPARNAPARRIGLHVGRWLRPVIPADFRPIAARQVARALLRAVPVATGHRVLLSGEMQADALPA